MFISGHIRFYLTLDTVEAYQCFRRHTNRFQCFLYSVFNFIIQNLPESGSPPLRTYILLTWARTLHFLFLIISLRYWNFDLYKAYIYIYTFTIILDYKIIFPQMLFQRPQRRKVTAEEFILFSDCWVLINLKGRGKKM